MIVGIAVPFFGGLLGFFGGFAFAPTTYFVRKKDFFPSSTITNYNLHKWAPAKVFVFYSLQLPCIMWLIIYKPKRFSLSWITNWVC
jgi:hypothetical protein